MNEQDLRDCFAMFALNGLVSHLTHDSVVDPSRIGTQAYMFADAMLDARKPKEVGIKAVRKSRKTNDEEN